MDTMRTVLTALVLLLPAISSALEISHRYRSPRNPERKVRASTELIVLHTTEAPARSSLNKLCDRGEAHYCITEYGQIYAIVDRDREAFHAGRSMWHGKEDVDKFSIGIECVGHHDKAMPAIQLAAIRDLVRELKLMYRLSDDRVVCHSHVAYGAPNKWHRRRHRGRKRCGMLFAMPSVRIALGLRTRPGCDLDTRAGRLVVGDDYLQQVLYGRIDTMAGRVGSSGGGYAKAAPKPQAASARRSSAPAATKHASGGTSPPTSISQLKNRGYVLKGTVNAKTSASKIAGDQWNSANTYYVIRNKIIPGNQINAAKIEKGMGVWMKR